MSIFHLTFATEGRLPPFPDEASRREAVCILHRVAGTALVLYFVVDDHLHAVLLCDRQRAGRLARAILLALERVCAAPLAPADIRPVRNRDHMQTLVPYLLTQLDHHGVPGNQATWAGSPFPDLVGARIIGSSPLRIRDALPRFRLGEAYAAVGLRRQEIQPWPIDMIAVTGAARLAAAATAAMCAPPGSPTNQPREVRARASAARLASAAGIRTMDMAAALGISSRGVRSARGRAVSEAELRAVRMWLALDEAARVLPEIRDGARRGGDRRGAA
jgi:hypothetical protein